LNLGLNRPPPLGGNAIKTCLVNNLLASFDG